MRRLILSICSCLALFTTPGFCAETTELTFDQDPPSAFKEHKTTDLRLELPSGQTIDIGAIFKEQGDAFERSLASQIRANKPTLIRINHEESTLPLLVAARRGKVLHGAFASFSDEGSPVAYVEYDKGERDATLFTWDEGGHPLVFAQYDSGELNGLRCLFRTCCESCDNVHVWVVQEWHDGQLRQAHIVKDDNKVATIGRWMSESSPSYDRQPSSLESAITELASFERKFEKDELKLKQLASHHYYQHRQAIQNRANLLAAQQRYRFMMGMQAGGSTPSFAAFPSGGV